MRCVAADRPAREPVALAVHGDLLDPSCWLAERRVASAAEELGSFFGPVAYVALPRSWELTVPSAACLRRRARELRRAAGEADAPRLCTEPWLGPGPSGSAPAMVAVAAAELQGRAAATSLRAALREAALSSGLDVSRRDVLLEVAARTGLDLGRFIAALDAPATERALRDEVASAAELGISCGPALVIGGEWLVAGLRPLRDYRTVLRHYLGERAGVADALTVH